VPPEKNVEAGQGIEEIEVGNLVLDSIGLAGQVAEPVAVVLDRFPGCMRVELQVAVAGIVDTVVEEEAAGTGIVAQVLMACMEMPLQLT
jgi:hypothetical protein